MSTVTSQWSTYWNSSCTSARRKVNAGLVCRICQPFLPVCHYVSLIFAVIMCPSVCPSHVEVLQKWLLSAAWQHKDFSFMVQKISKKFRRHHPKRGHQMQVGQAKVAFSTSGEVSGSDALQPKIVSIHHHGPRRCGGRGNMWCHQQCWLSWKFVYHSVAQWCLHCCKGDQLFL